MTVDNLAVLLRAREKELSAIYENVPGILFYIAVEPDGEFRFRSVSRDFLVATGLTREKIVGSLVREVIPEPSRDMVLNLYRKAILSGQTVRWEEESVYPAGRRYGEVAVTPLYDTSGVATHLIGIVHDVTERKGLEDSLRESEERLRLAMSSSTTGIWDWDMSSGQLTVSSEVRRMFGLDVTELRSYEDFAARVHPDDLARIESERDAAILNHQRFDTEFRILLPSGDIRWIASRGQAYYDENGHVVRMVGNSIDVTERVQAKEALREREQRLRLALDASRAGSWMLDPRTGRVDWDDRYREIYGLTNAEPASFEAWLSRVHEEDRQLVLEVVDQLMQKTQTQDRFDCTFRIVQHNGSVSWIQSLGQAYRDAEGQVIRFTGLELDVTERRSAEEALQARRDEERERALHRQAEKALRRSHAELERSHAALEQSHAELEQRTLQLRRLASQLTLAEQSARRQLASTLHDGLQQLLFSAGITLDEATNTNSPDDQVELLQRARGDIKEAMAAARTLSMNLFPPVLHVGGLPAALAWLARRTQEQYNVVVSVTADPEANPVASDARILLFEGVRELLFNAVKHARVDRVDVSLALGPGDTIHIQVSDDGIGFDPSATLHNKNQRRAGLGLFSIQERFALFGGHLEIQSIPGKGSRFTLTLPRTGLPRGAADATDVQRRDTAWQERLVYDSASGRSKSLRILIADDHAVARVGLRELFGKRPELQVVGEAASGIEAITQAVALQPDVMVMDVSMPQMNGIDATREIHRTLRHIRIVGLSTHDDESTERLMRRAGAEAYFTKNEGTDRLLDYLLSLVTQVKPASAG
jgi:PAS domain S-box-containing protein